jgi:hypothetical protein
MRRGSPRRPAPGPLSYPVKLATTGTVPPGTVARRRMNGIEKRFRGAEGHHRKRQREYRRGVGLLTCGGGQDRTASRGRARLATETLSRRQERADERARKEDPPATAIMHPPKSSDPTCQSGRLPACLPACRAVRRLA